MHVMMDFVGVILYMISPIEKFFKMDLFGLPFIGMFIFDVKLVMHVKDLALESLHVILNYPLVLMGLLRRGE